MLDGQSHGMMSNTAKPRIVAIIQARMASTRLPGKALLDLGGKPILQHVVERVRMSKQVAEVVVATTDHHPDDAIASLCQGLEVSCYRGEEDDVLKRFLGAVEQTRADVVVRITADCPLIDPDVVDRVIRAYETTGVEYASNGIHRSWPRGFDVEVFRAETLRRADKLATRPYEREHVTAAIYMAPTVFRCTNVEAPHEAYAPDFRVCIDTKEDLEVVRRILSSTKDPASLRAADVVAFLRENPRVLALNRNVRQKGLGD